MDNLKELLEKCDLAEKEYILSDLIDSMDENCSEDERRTRSQMNMYKRSIIRRERLYILIKLNHSDSGACYDEMTSALEDVLHAVVSESHFYDSKDKQDAYVLSFFEVFFGDEFDFIRGCLPDNYKDAGRLCDGYLLFKMISYSETFNEQEALSKCSGRIIDSFILFAEQNCEPDVLFTLIKVLLKEHLIKADPYRAAELYIKYKSDVAEYLDGDTADQLFNMANELISSDDANTAKSVFDGLYILFRLYYRESSRICWLIKMKIAGCEILLDRNIKNCEALMVLVKDGIDGKVTDIEDEEEFRTNIAEFCSALLSNAFIIKKLSGFGECVEYFYDYCRKHDYVNEIVNMHRANEYMGAYHCERGEFLKSEQFYIKMINDNYTEENRTEGRLVASLHLMCIYILINSEKRFSIAESTYDFLYNNYYDIIKVTDRNIRLAKIIISIYIELYMLEMNKKQMIKGLKFIEKYNLISNEITCVEDALTVCEMISVRLELGEISKANFKSFLVLLKKAEDFNNKEKNNILAVQITAMYGCLYSFDDIDKQLLYLEKAYQEHDGSNKIFDIQSRANKAFAIAKIYMQKSDLTNAKKYMDKALKVDTEILSTALRYLDEEKLVNILEATETTIRSIYYYLSCINDEQLYDYVLKYKELRSYVVSMRNAILRSYSDKSGVLLRIRRLRDQLARVNTNAVFFDTDAVEESLKMRLEELEAQFETEFPEFDISPKVSVNDVVSRLGNEQAVIEYVLKDRTPDNVENLLKYNDSGDKTRLFETFAESFEYEAFVVRNIDGKGIVSKEYIGSFNEVSELVLDFLDCMMDDGECDERSVTIAKVELYKKIIQPLLKHLNGVKDLIIAPVDMISAVAFDVLGQNRKDCLIDRYNIKYIECGRDLVNCHHSNIGSGALVIGDPAYDANGDSDPAGGRSRDFELTSLPFSGVETDRISKRLGCAAYTKKKAVKQRLLEAGGFRYIHIATHGDFDYDLETDPLFSSCIYFAGAQNWLDTGIESDSYGNGVVTADEISRLDLTGTELVVLSCCHSGAGFSYLMNNTPGLRSAFKAAGASYVVMSKWQLNDIAAAIMMDKFYEYLEIMAVPIALREAKLYLRNVSIKELEQNGWFDCSEKYDGCIMSQISELRRCDPELTPFHDIKYWGSMECMEC